MRRGFRRDTDVVQVVGCVFVRSEFSLWCRARILYCCERRADALVRSVGCVCAFRATLACATRRALAIPCEDKDDDKLAKCLHTIRTAPKCPCLSLCVMRSYAMCFDSHPSRSLHFFRQNTNHNRSSRLTSSSSTSPLVSRVTVSPVLPRCSSSSPVRPR